MTILNTETGELLENLDAVQARRLTDKIKVGIEGVWHLIEEAYTSRAWSALGYKSWDDYCTREFGTSRLRLPREDRREVVSSLRESGLSVRAIASATGVNRETIRQEISGDKKLSPVTNVTPQSSTAALPETKGQGADQREATVEDSSDDESMTRDGVDFGKRPPVITGTDGKSYPAKGRQAARPSRPAEHTLNLIESLADKAARETQKLTTDQIRRVKPNAAEWIGGIRRSVETLQGLLAALEQKD